MRRTAVVVVILLRRHASDKEAISCIEAELGDFSCIAYMKYVVSDHFR